MSERTTTLILSLVAFALSVLLLIFTLGSAPAASASCLDRQQARAKWPGKYLYWHYGDKKQRCWSDRKIVRAAHRVRHKPRIEVDIITWDHFNRIDAAAPPLPSMIERFYGETK